MRILIVHNHYGDYAFGGEAFVMQAESKMLRAHGHEVYIYECTNAEISRRHLWGKVKAFKDLTWSSEGYNAIAAVIDVFKPDLMHVHNYKWLLSPSIFKAAKERGVATCLTLHNYRLACPGGQFLRDGRICEDCLDGFPYRMLLYRCASKKIINNFAQFYLYQGTRKRNLLIPLVDAYIALTNFGKSKFVAAGIPSNKIFIKSNFIADLLSNNNEMKNRHGAIFIGRLSNEKGVEFLLRAWHKIDYPLSIVGDGPLSSKLRKSASVNVKFYGHLDRSACLNIMMKSAFMVFPSIWYEGFPLSLLESFSIGIPCIASDLGPRREMIRDGYNGFLYPSDNIAMLQNKARTLIENPELCENMGQNARAIYLERYTIDINYYQLINIYRNIINV